MYARIERKEGTPMKTKQLRENFKKQLPRIFMFLTLIAATTISIALIAPEQSPKPKEAKTDTRTK